MKPTYFFLVSQGRGTLSRVPLQELYDPSMESSAANLDDLQRSWETLKNVVCHIFTLIQHIYLFLLLLLDKHNDKLRISLSPSILSKARVVPNSGLKF